MCGKWQQASNVTANVQSDHLLHGYMLPVFLPLINCIVHHALLKFSPCRNKMLPQLVRIADWWYLIHVKNEKFVHYLRAVHIHQLKSTCACHNTTNMNDAINLQGLHETFDAFIRTYCEQIGQQVKKARRKLLHDTSINLSDTHTHTHVIYLTQRQQTYWDSFKHHAIASRSWNWWHAPTPAHQSASHSSSWISVVRKYLSLGSV